MNLRLGIINRATYLYMLLEVESSAVPQQMILKYYFIFKVVYNMISLLS